MPSQSCKDERNEPEMASGNRSRGVSKTGRQTTRIPRKRRILVVSGGDVTEPQYFEEILNSEFTEVHFHHETAKANPDAIAKRAVQLKKQDRKRCESREDGRSQPYAQVFVIADVDNFTTKQFSDAQSTCRANGIGLIVSNPCFEVWLIDHSCACPNGIFTPSDAQARAAREGLVHGNGNKYIVKDLVQGRAKTAVDNAGQHNTSARAAARRLLTNFSTWAPFTDMPSVFGRCGIQL